MKYLKTLFAGALIAVLAGSAWAAELPVYKCDMTQIGRTGWISNIIFFEVDEKANTAKVLDAYTKEYSGGVIEVEKFQNQAGWYRFKWTIRDIRVSNVKELAGRALYSASMNKETLALQVRVTLSQYDNNPWGAGQCKPYKGR